ncbi:MAG: type I restriction enzyme S subunit [Gammaproteobacteria bacterium]|jgi:type I restriction enzyme S subunit|tara:strand:+ start:1408 stop:2646 length:1239 start_codon:yes stop_codon:yes gene_type:complete
MEWLKTTLGKVCDVRDGTHDSPKYQESGYPLVTSKNLKNGEITLDKIKYISESDFTKINQRSAVHIGDVLFAMIGTIGNPVVIKHPPNFAIKNVALFKAREECDSQFLKYYLESPYVIEKMESEAKGTTQKFVGLGYLRQFPVTIPPIPEQKRIVAILDQAFADIEQARAKTEQNLKNARELFESYLQQVFSQRGEGWVETTLGQEINLLTGFAFKSKEYVTHADSIPLIRGDNIVQGKLRWDGVKLWANDKVDEYEKYQLKEDDILIAMDRTWVKAGMKYAKITSEDLPALLVQRVARLRCTDSLDSDYLYHLMGSKLFESYVLSIQTGLGVPHISGKQIQSFIFMRPSMEQQKIEVETMNELAREVLKLNKIYESKLAAIDELKKSILQKAFSGELTKTLEGGANKGAVA